MTLNIYGGRCSGRTAMLIKMSAATGKYILCRNRQEARHIADMANEMKLYIPYPVTVEEYFKSDKFTGSFIRRDGLLIDNVDLVVKEIFKGIDIHAVTFEKTPEMYEIKWKGECQEDLIDRATFEDFEKSVKAEINRRFGYGIFPEVSEDKVKTSGSTGEDEENG